MKSKLDQLQYDSAVDSATGMYTKMCDTINHVVETVLPTTIRKKGINHKVSEKTQALYDKRTNMKDTKAQYKEVQEQIKQSSLQDFKDWVSEWAESMQAANAVGNTHKVYQGVKVL